MKMVHQVPTTKRMNIEEETIEKVKEEPTRSPQAGPSKYTCLQCLNSKRKRI